VKLPRAVPRDPSRRRFLLSGLAAGSAVALPALIGACSGGDAGPDGPGTTDACASQFRAGDAEAIPGPDELPTLAEMEARSDALARSAPDLVEVRALGQSRAGRPIRLFSIGEGPRSALIVGAPHPNEPVGCATIEQFMEALLRAPRLRERLGYRWHFIKAIDPDGVVLNEGWFKGRRTPARYLASFYRPAFRAQPEYTFPLEVAGYRFDAPTPENLCWRKALELTRPQLQCSLHNADIGGAFFLTSRNVPALTRALARLPRSASVSVNAAGEPFAETAPLGPGVFEFPDLRAMVQAVAARNLPVADYWNAGCSSAQFAAERYGTFSMTCEVPLWETAGASVPPASGCGSANLVEQQLRANGEARALLSRHLPGLESKARNGDERMLYEALADAARNVSVQEPRLGRLLRIKRLQGWLPMAFQRLLGVEGGNLEPMPCSIHASMALALRLGNLRLWAMLMRLCDQVSRHSPDGPIEQGRREAGRHLEQQLAGLELEAPLRAVPLGTLVSLQYRAILEAASCAGARGAA